MIVFWDIVSLHPGLSIKSYLKTYHFPLMQGYESQQSGTAELQQKAEHQAKLIDSLEVELSQLKQERQIERERQMKEVSNLFRCFMKSKKCMCFVN